MGYRNDIYIRVRRLPNAMQPIRCKSLNEIFIKCFKRQRLDNGEILRTNTKRLCGFGVSHIVTHCYVAAHRVAWSVCHSVTLVSHAKVAEMIKLPFVFQTRVGPMNHVLHEVQMRTWERAILRGETGKPL